MWLKAQNEMAGLWPHAAMGPVERMVRRQSRRSILTANRANLLHLFARLQHDILRSRLLHHLANLPSFAQIGAATKPKQLHVCSRAYSALA